MKIKEFYPSNFSELEPYWKKIENGKDMTGFQLYDWYRNVNTLFFREKTKKLFRKWIYFLVTDDNDNPIMIAPIQIVKVGFHIGRHGIRRGAYFIGREGYSDYMNFIYNDFDTDAVEYVIQYLHSKYNCEYFRFEQVMESSELHKFMLSKYNARKIPLSCASLVLPDTFEEYHQSLSKSMRQNIRTAINRANKNNITLTHEIIFDLDDETRKELMLMREKRLGDKIKKSKKKASFLGRIYNDCGMIVKKLFNEKQDIMKEACNQWCFCVKDGERIIGYYWGIKNEYKKEYYVILAGVDRDYEWYSPCISHLYLFLKEYYEAGRNDIAAFDFTRGGEKYKHDIGCSDRLTSGLEFRI
ncbi:MAG: GNAT family N-acetyltransferase [Ruminococcaceae bacterium]|nr:GNAT family N-acetyltransferase [Oscillospiraceae bacterium]